MTGILSLSMKELRKRKFFSLLMLVICVIAMQTVISAITNAASAAWQQKIFENSIGCDLNTVLHLDYQYTEETLEFAEVLTQYRSYIASLDGVKAVGMFDATGTYFSELNESEEYQAVNAKIISGGKYANYPARVQLLNADEDLLDFVKGGISEYAETTNGTLPIYASEIFQEVLPVGTSLTDERTGDQYEVVGYIPLGSRWVEEDDLIRYPMISLDGWFIAPFTEGSETDILTQLSSLHNTYVLLSDDADIDDLKQAISDWPEQHGFQATTYTLAEEYAIYRAETGAFTVRQIVLAVFISFMAVSSIVSVFTTNALLKRKQYGILIANGFQSRDIVKSIIAEIFVIMFLSAFISWTIKWLELKRSTDLFREVLLEAHSRYTLPICFLITVALTGVATLLPAIKVFSYQPCELIGGDAHGAD